MRFNERFRLGAAAAASGRRRRCATRWTHCERVNAGEPITLFEITTAAAFLLFARHPADVLLLEVGLGGRLDATNVIDAPLASVITPVGIDHVEFLGDTLAQIAAEKAGIIKRGVPVIVARAAPEALAVIERRGASACARRCTSPARTGTSSEEHGRLVYQDERGLLDLPAPRLFGRHQFDNAGSGDRDAARDRRACSIPTRGVRGRRRARRMAGADAAADLRRAGRRCAAPAPSSGSTAGTMPTAAASSPRRSAISRSACRGRWC